MNDKKCRGVCQFSKKRCYAKADAESVLVRMRRNDLQTALEVYKCRHCGWHHLGSVVGRSKLRPEPYRRTRDGRFDVDKE